MEKKESLKPDDGSINGALEENGVSSEEHNIMENKQPSASEYPGTKEVITAFMAILLATFLTSLDRTIIATAIPRITDEFHSLDDIGWYGSAYLLTASCFQLVVGKIYTFWSPKYLYLLMIVVFEIGSVVCGAAPSSVAFIVGRAIAGIGTAGIQAGNVILLTSVVPLAKRPAYMGLFGAVMGISAVIGPLLGGAFTTDVTWRWCFYINLPIGGVAMITIFFILRPIAPVSPGLSWRQKLAQLDLLGELFLFPSIICLLLALQWGGSTYAWENGRIIALFVVFGLCLLAFFAVEAFMPETATISVRLIRNRSMIAGMLFQVCFSAVMMLMLYYIPVWLQAIKGRSAVQSGIDTLPMLLSLVVSSILAGRLTGYIGYYAPFAIASAVFTSVGAGLITTWNVNSGAGEWIGYQVIFGFGLGLGMQQAILAAQTVLAKKDVPIGVSLMFFCQQLSGAVFLSVGQNVLDSTLISRLQDVLHEIKPGTVVNTGATELRNKVPVAKLPQVLDAYNSAVKQVFIVGVCLACMVSVGAFALEWRSVKGKQGPTGKEETSTESGTREKAAEGV